MNSETDEQCGAAARQTRRRKEWLTGFEQDPDPICTQLETMIQPPSDEKSTALDTLYTRIERIAPEMGGTASRLSVNRDIPPIMTATPQTEGVPALIVSMPGKYEVKIAPLYPPSMTTLLSVWVRRSQGGLLKDNRQRFSLSTDGVWQGDRRTPLSDDEIRESLMLTAPPPAVF